MSLCKTVFCTKCPKLDDRVLIFFLFMARCVQLGAVQNGVQRGIGLKRSLFMSLCKVVFCTNLQNTG
jgi:hypothetical protein